MSKTGDAYIDEQDRPEAMAVVLCNATDCVNNGRGKCIRKVVEIRIEEWDMGLTTRECSDYEKEETT
jgi:hypothetical protein